MRCPTCGYDGYQTDDEIRSYKPQESQIKGYILTGEFRVPKLFEYFWGNLERVNISLNCDFWSQTRTGVCQYYSSCDWQETAPVRPAWILTKTPEKELEEQERTKRILEIAAIKTKVGWWLNDKQYREALMKAIKESE